MNGLTRRAAMGAGAALLAAGAVPLSGARAAPGADGKADDPRRSPLGQIKMEGCLDGSPAIWTYNGILYAVRPAQRPLPILGLAGGSATWCIEQDDGSWRMLGATMSFFLDVDSGAFLDRFANPFTGRTNEVRANRLAGGGMTFPADGSPPRFNGRSSAGESAPGGFDEADPSRPIGRVEWNLTDTGVLMVTDHAFEVPVQPQLEARTIFADRAQFFDPAVKRMPARMATSTITPWLRWLDMGDEPGHLVWHTSGEKLFSIDALHASYREHAGADLDLFRSPPSG